MCIRGSVWTLQGTVASLPPVGNLTLYTRLPICGLVTVPNVPSGNSVVILSRTKKEIFSEIKKSGVLLQKLIVFQQLHKFPPFSPPSKLQYQLHKSFTEPQVKKYCEPEQ